MNSLMSQKTSSPRECFPTCKTFVRLYTCMGCFMCHKIASTWKFIPTDATFERCVTRMSSLMIHKIFTPWILFPTYETSETLFASMCPLLFNMQFTLWRLWTTNFMPEWSVYDVCLAMFSEMLTWCTSFFAYVTTQNIIHLLHYTGSIFNSWLLVTVKQVFPVISLTQASFKLSPPKQKLNIHHSLGSDNSRNIQHNLHTFLYEILVFSTLLHNST
jgi:hypothetical protein